MSSRPGAGSPLIPAAAIAAPRADELERAQRSSANGGDRREAVGIEMDGALRAQRDAPVGGQAVLEGVMMRGVRNWAVAVRKPAPDQLADGEYTLEDGAAGEIEVSTFPLESAARRHRVLRLPIVRGVVALGGSLVIGFRALEISASAQLPAAEAGENGADGG